nr:MAG TPA: hypothetical protein [Bacteriophage sp.]
MVRCSTIEPFLKTIDIYNSRKKERQCIEYKNRYRR